MQNNMISIRITGIYWSQSSFVAFVCKTAALGPELQVSMGPRPHLWFLHAKQRPLDQNYKSLWVPDITYGFCIKTVTFASQLQVSMVLRVRLLIYACKTASLHPD